MNQGVYLPVYGLYLGSGGPSATEVCGLRKTAISMRESVLSRGTLDNVSDSVLALFWIFLSSCLLVRPNNGRGILRSLL